MGKTEGSLIGFIAFFLKFEELKISLAKMIDLVPLGVASGPGAPDVDLARFHIRVTPMEHTKIIEIPMVLLTC